VTQPASSVSPAAEIGAWQYAYDADNNKALVIDPIYNTATKA
jgi:hypothetical protein